MWHVDEGALHAYLDGALDEYPAAEARRVREHLEACAECSERLDQERRVRAEAQEILGLAAPRVEVPSFEELRAYVRAQAPRRSAVSARLYKLGWAASVVLALGTGWLLRGDVAPTLTRPGEAGIGASGVSRAPAADPAAEMSAADEQQRSNEVGSEVSSGPAPAATPSGARAVRELGSVDAVDAGGTAGGVGTAPNAAAPPQADVVASSPALSAAPAEARREAERFGAAAGAAPRDGATGTAFADAVDVDQAATKAADDTADLVAANAQQGAAARVTRTAPAAPSPEPAAAVGASGARQDTVRPDAQPAQRAAVDQRLTSAIAASAPLPPTAVAPGVVAPEVAAGSTTLGRGADADAPDPPSDAAEEEPVSLVVPGLEVLDVLPVGEGTSFRGMRALQRLQAGDTLELVHLPEGIDPSSLPPLRPGWSELVRPRGSGWLVMRAPVAEASLVELLQRLESGR